MTDMTLGLTSSTHMNATRNGRSRLASLLLTSTILGCALPLSSTGALAQAQPAAAANETLNFQIPAQSLSSAINAFIRQSGWQISYSSALARGKTSAAISGSMTPEVALQKLVAGTGVSVRVGAPGSAALIDPSTAAVDAPIEDGSTVLETITVQGQGATTEGAGYSTNVTSTTATPLGLSIKETPQSISVVPRQQLDDQKITDVKQALRQTAGLTVGEIGSERYGVTSRGYNISSFQLDGVDTFLDVTTQNVPQSMSDLVIYDHVEVLRGPSGLMTGGGDPGGTINLVRKKPTSDFQGYLSSGTGSWDKYRGEFDFSGSLNKAGTVRGRVVGAHQGNNSFIDYYGQKNTILYGVIEADVTDSTVVTVGADYQHSRSTGQMGGIGLPLFYSTGEQITDFSRSTSFASRHNWQDVDTVNVFGEVKQELWHDWTFDAKINYLQAKRDWSYVGPNTWTALADPVTGLGVTMNSAIGEQEQRQVSFNANLKGTYDLFGRSHDLAIGFSYLDYKDEASYWDRSTRSDLTLNIFDWDHSGLATKDGAIYKFSNTSLIQYGGYIAHRFKATDKISIISGARLSNYKLDYDYILPASGYQYDEDTKENGIITPYAGVVFDLTDNHSVYASYTTIFKPQVYHDQSGAFIDPREGVNYEVGLKSEFFDGALSTRIAAYHLTQDNLAVADGTYEVGGSTETAYRTVDGATTKGFEVEAVGEIANGWNVAGSYTYSYTEDADGLRIQTLYPEHLFKLWTTYRLPGEWEKLTIGAGVNWQSEIYFTSTPWRIGKELTARQSAYAVVNLMAKYDFNEHVTATLNVNNVFDKKYFSSLDETFLSGYYGAPRNVTFDLKYKF